MYGAVRAGGVRGQPNWWRTRGSCKKKKVSRQVGGFFFVPLSFSFLCWCADGTQTQNSIQCIIRIWKQCVLCAGHEWMERAKGIKFWAVEKGCLVHFFPQTCRRSRLKANCARCSWRLSHAVFGFLWASVYSRKQFVWAAWI